MNFSILYSVFIVFFLLLLTDSIDLNQQCPTSRRLLLFSSLKLPFGEKKSPTPSRHTTRSITYIQPQTSQELGRKVRSYTHLLKPKLFTNEEKLQLKQSQKLEKKKTIKKKDTIEHTKTKDLIVPINKQEIDRCRSLLQLDEKKTKKIKRDIPTTTTTTKVKNATNQPVKTVKKKVDSVPTTESKVKSTKKTVKIPSKPLENLKYKASKPETITIIEQIRSPFDERNDSAVNRAFYFVRSMFQLSEPSSDESQLDDDPIIDLTSEQQTLHHHSRKLLSISQYQFPTFVNLPNRQLLATKSKSAVKQKNKTSNSKNESKPKVGWAYRYRISRYLDAQKSRHKRTGRDKKSSQSISKRKLLQFDGDEESLDSNEIYRSDQNSINTVTIMTSFVPKRQLLTTKSKTTHDIDVDKKKKDKHVDPIAIVPSDEQHSQKPHVGWEFRYRVSKYMNSLQDSIAADQKRLKSDLHKVKQKRKVAKSSVSSQTVDNEELQAQQDAALDPELAQISDEGRKVGWAYRYRIRRKLDHLKAIEAETGVPFDLATLSGKREKKVNVTKPKVKTKTNLKKKNQTTPVPPSEANKKAVGWEYRYRVQRKADALQQAAAAAATNQNIKPPKKTKKKVTKKTNSPPITSFFSTLVSKTKNSVCFLPGPNLLPFCSSGNSKSTVTNKTAPRAKKLRTKTENRAKQFIHARITKLGAQDKATERRVDEQMKRLYKKPSYPPIQQPPSPPPPSSTVDSAAHSSKSHEHVEKVIAVDSKKTQNKKKNQIIGQEVPIKPKHASPPTQPKTSEPVTPSVPLRSIAEVIKQEAATILKSERKESQTPEEIQYEINETKEIVREQKLLKATPAAKSTSLNDTENAAQT